jgi:hypothetical protein
MGVICPDQRANGQQKTGGNYNLSKAEYHILHFSFGSETESLPEFIKFCDVMDEIERSGQLQDGTAFLCTPCVIVDKACLWKTSGRGGGIGTTNFGCSLCAVNRRLRAVSQAGGCRRCKAAGLTCLHHWDLCTPEEMQRKRSRYEELTELLAPDAGDCIWCNAADLKAQCMRRGWTKAKTQGKETMEKLSEWLESWKSGSRNRGYVLPVGRTSMSDLV